MERVLLWGALGIGGFLALRAVAKAGSARAAAAKNIPEGWALTMCSDYQGHKLCVFSRQRGNEAAGNAWSEYRGNIDGGALVDWTAMRAADVFDYLQGIVDSSG